MMFCGPGCKGLNPEDFNRNYEILGEIVYGQ